jgi:putative nucleotidyltransferase with HDIG domain
MASGIRRRTRSERVAALELPPGFLERTWDYLQRGDVLLRIGLCAVCALVLWMITGGWAPPLSYRTGYTPLRNIVARVHFEKPEPQRTQEAHERAQREVRFVYEQDIEPLVQLRAGLMNQVSRILKVQSLAELEEGVWQEFFAAPTPDKAALLPAEQEQHFQEFRAALSTPEALAHLEKSVADALQPWEQHGLLKELPQEQKEGNQKEIVVFPKGRPLDRQSFNVSDVILGDAHSLKKRLAAENTSPEVVERVFDWLRPQLIPTLSLNNDETRRAREEANARIHDVVTPFEPGDLLARAGQPLATESMELLEREHKALTKSLGLLQRVCYSLATLGMFVALLTLCGVYVLAYERRLIANMRQFLIMLGLVIVTVGLTMLAGTDSLRAELIPLLLFGMTVSIAYHQESALLFSAALALVVVVSIGQGLYEFIILNAAVATAILLVGPIRSRWKLIYVGMCVGVVVILTTIGVGTLAEQPFYEMVLPDAVRFGLWSLLATIVMSGGLLPLVERMFGVQTDLSLLELADISHPLLQELVRRAPGTYNHSINVASIAEAAAESIHARGLLVRVGAYFHDIGKMLKPAYFVENQGTDNSRHDTLVPAMSTLIIIAHVKDGADLARQHHLPETLLDFIQQHHGTTLVEYFYHRANERSETDPDGGEVEESAFRYPGPKPQTKEAAVLMLADAVEGASRALAEPTPARIESLVHDIAMKRLLDGQFDQCSLTLRELATVEDSLIKSLTAVYHGRIKYPEHRGGTSYPEQRTA